MIRGVEGRGAQRIDPACGVLEALGIPASEGYLGPLHACSSRRFKPDAAATADHDNGLPEEFWFALHDRDDGCGAHDSFDQQSKIRFRCKATIICPELKQESLSIETLLLIFEQLASFGKGHIQLRHA
jgi:hypothetical protein